MRAQRNQEATLQRAPAIRSTINHLLAPLVGSPVGWSIRSIGKKSATVPIGTMASYENTSYLRRLRGRESERWKWRRLEEHCCVLFALSSLLASNANNNKNSLDFYLDLIEMVYKQSIIRIIIEKRVDLVRLSLRRRQNYLITTKSRCSWKPAQLCTKA